MKKLLFVFLLLSLTGCLETNVIDKTLFVYDLGVDYDSETELYTTYFHFIPTKSLAKVEMSGLNESSGSAMAYFSSENLYTTFERVFSSTNLNLNMEHMNSLIIHKDALNIEVIEFFIKFNKKYPQSSSNYYITSTDDDIKSIFEVSNPDNIPSFYNKLTDILSSENKFIEQIRFRDMVKMYNDDSLELMIPYIKETPEIWIEDDKPLKSIGYAGYCFLDSDCIEITEHLGFIWLIDHKKLENLYKDKVITFKNYKINAKYDDQLILNISYKIRNSFEEVPTTEIENKIRDEINDLFEFSKEADIDIFKVNYYSKGIANPNFSIKINIDYNEY